MSVFTDEYTISQIEFMDLPADEVTVGESAFYWRRGAVGRMDDYLNVNYRDEPIDVPTYRDKSGLWMSITPMEVQSAVVAINRAMGHDIIAIGGLGMGYVPLAIAAAEDGPRVIDIYELNEECVELFKAMHKDKEGFDKFQFIIGDVYENLTGKVYDYVFMDVYQTLAPDEMKEDIAEFLQSNTIREYRYWGQELMLYLASQDEGFRDMTGKLREANILTFDDAMLFSDFMDTEGSEMNPPIFDTEFAMECIEDHLLNQEVA